jgi:hypothetical protein
VDGGTTAERSVVYCSSDSVTGFGEPEGLPLALSCRQSLGGTGFLDLNRVAALHSAHLAREGIELASGDSENGKEEQEGA